MAWKGKAIFMFFFEDIRDSPANYLSQAWIIFRDVCTTKMNVYWRKNIYQLGKIKNILVVVAHHTKKRQSHWTGFLWKPPACCMSSVLQIHKAYYCMAELHYTVHVWFGGQTTCHKFVGDKGYSHEEDVNGKKEWTVLELVHVLSYSRTICSSISGPDIFCRFRNRVWIC